MVSPLLQSALSIVLPVIIPSAGHLNLFYSLGILYISGSISKGLRRNWPFVWSAGVHQYRNDRYLLSGLEFVPLGYIPRITHCSSFGLPVYGVRRKKWIEGFILQSISPLTKFILYIWMRPN